MSNKYVDEFIEAIEADGKSQCTVSGYRYDLEKFSNEIEKDIISVEYSDLRAWANKMSKSGLAATSRARKISAVKSMYKYLKKVGYIHDNPAIDLDTPKLEKKIPKVITADNASDILFHARNDGGTEITYMRDLAIMMTFLYTGVRREEITNIKLKDVDLKSREILIHGKGNKQRSAYINDELLAVLSEYVAAYRKNFSSAVNSEYLFVSIKSEKLSTRAVNNIVNKFMESAGCKEKGMSCHQLRKRMATSAFYATHDLISVQRILGHSSPTVTQRYIASDTDSMRKATMSVSF